MCVCVHEWVCIFVCVNACMRVCLMCSDIHICICVASYLRVITFQCLIIRGDFTVQWYHHPISTCSVFLLLHQMAIALLDKSIVYHKKLQGKGKVPVSTIYQRIFWGKCVHRICLHIYLRSMHFC